MEAGRNTSTNGRMEALLDRIRPFEGQPRQHFDLEGLKQLAASIRAVGQLVPATVKEVSRESHDFELIEGERRWRACRMVGISKLWIVVEGRAQTSEEQYELSAIANFCRAGLSHLESVHVVGWFYERGHSDRDIADRLGCTAGWVGQLRAILRLSPEVQKLMHPSIAEKKRLKFSVAHEIAVRVPPEKEVFQLELARYCLAHNFRLHQAKSYIQRRTRGLNTAPRRREVRRDRVYGSLLTFLDRIESEVGEQLAIPPDMFERMFADKKRVTIQMVAKSLRKTAGKLGNLAAKIEAL